MTNDIQDEHLLIAETVMEVLAVSEIAFPMYPSRQQIIQTLHAWAALEGEMAAYFAREQSGEVEDGAGI